MLLHSRCPVWQHETAITAFNVTECTECKGPLRSRVMHCPECFVRNTLPEHAVEQQRQLPDPSEYLIACPSCQADINVLATHFQTTCSACEGQISFELNDQEALCPSCYGIQPLRKREFVTASDMMSPERLKPSQSNNNNGDGFSQRKTQGQFDGWNALEESMETILDSCCICLCALDEELSIATCGHLFHAECSEKISEVGSMSSKKCPLCRDAAFQPISVHWAPRRVVKELYESYEQWRVTRAQQASGGVTEHALKEQTQADAARGRKELELVRAAVVAARVTWQAEKQSNSELEKERKARAKIIKHYSNNLKASREKLEASQRQAADIVTKQRALQRKLTERSSGLQQAEAERRAQPHVTVYFPQDIDFASSASVTEQHGNTNVSAQQLTRFRTLCHSYKQMALGLDDALDARTKLMEAYESKIAQKTASIDVHRQELESVLAEIAELERDQTSQLSQPTTFAQPREFGSSSSSDNDEDVLDWMLRNRNKTEASIQSPDSKLQKRNNNNDNRKNDNGDQEEEEETFLLGQRERRGTEEQDFSQLDDSPSRLHMNPFAMMYPSTLSSSFAPSSSSSSGMSSALPVKLPSKRSRSAVDARAYGKSFEQQMQFKLANKTAPRGSFLPASGSSVQHTLEALDAQGSYVPRNQRKGLVPERGFRAFPTSVLATATVMRQRQQHQAALLMGSGKRPAKARAKPIKRKKKEGALRGAHGHRRNIFVKKKKSASFS